MTRTVRLPALAAVILAAAVLAPAPAAAQTAPATGFEADGQWTSLAEEAVLLAAVDAQPSAAVTEVGTTLQGRPLRLVAVGAAPTQTGSAILHVCSQHGNEQAGREGCLQLARDLAFGLAPVPAGATVLIVPTANPDGFAAATREESRGEDINRDHLDLGTAEARAVADTVGRYRPDVLVDHHEYRVAPGIRVLQGSPRRPNVDPDVTDLAVALHAAIDVRLEEANFVTGLYEGGGDTSEYEPRTLANVASMKHTPSALIETAVAAPRPDRVRAQRVAADAVHRFLTERGADLAFETADARDDAATTVRPLVWTSDSSAQPPCRWLLTPAQLNGMMRWRFGLHRLLTRPGPDGSTAVVSAQPMRSVAAQLLDGRAPYHVIAAKNATC